MLTIREAQMGMLEDTRKADALRMMAGYAARRFPAVFSGKPPERIHASMLKIFELASDTHGFRRDDHLALWVDLVVMFGMDFPSAAWAAPILKDPALQPDAKAELLRRQVSRTGIAI